jgi:hypothetical protein
LGAKHAKKPQKKSDRKGEGSKRLSINVIKTNIPSCAITQNNKHGVPLHDPSKPCPMSRTNFRVPEALNLPLPAFKLGQLS